VQVFFWGRGGDVQFGVVLPSWVGRLLEVILPGIRAVATVAALATLHGDSHRLLHLTLGPPHLHGTATALSIVMLRSIGNVLGPLELDYAVGICACTQVTPLCDGHGELSLRSSYDSCVLIRLIRSLRLSRVIGRERGA
jgi:hypothetical protein